MSPEVAVLHTENLSHLAVTGLCWPEVLLLDEPTSSSDENTKRDVESLICDIIRDGTLAALMVTHDKDQARPVARQAMVVDSVRLVDFGPGKEVLDPHPGRE